MKDEPENGSEKQSVKAVNTKNRFIPLISNTERNKKQQPYFSALYLVRPVHLSLYLEYYSFVGFYSAQ